MKLSFQLRSVIRHQQCHITALSSTFHHRGALLFTPNSTSKEVKPRHRHTQHIPASPAKQLPFLRRSDGVWFYFVFALSPFGNQVKQDATLMAGWEPVGACLPASVDTHKSPNGATLPPLVPHRDLKRQIRATWIGAFERRDRVGSLVWLETLAMCGYVWVQSIYFGDGGLYVCVCAENRSSLKVPLCDLLIKMPLCCRLRCKQAIRFRYSIFYWAVNKLPYHPGRPKNIVL